jgi:sulfatase maturation enzyme AslB (radical SAM superfamily)
MTRASMRSIHEPYKEPGILKIMNAVHPHVLAHNVRVMASVTTNAVLLEPRLDELLSAQITGFQITLEGVSSVHDQTRVGPDRKPTFPIIWPALTSLRNHGGSIRQQFACTTR